MAAIPDVTDEYFEPEVLQSELPVLVDFWGDHCPACRLGARSKLAFVELLEQAQ